ncbi:hydroxyacylglutathione hydrolase [Hyphomicrobium methylovorum]|uniref:hydroxyacylglutathione hydrolase n=1 Tax=Hyphomicrobium methylovorum TaxID=84 RepID=UPI0015E7095F|nr:hydroxyacylglutathione hydrolase [Hyphomicrobium methylovorum]MBA2125749.1 hydroxyacylglutathione hydrolase [Hyphomicrobium methylovorum]
MEAFEILLLPCLSDNYAVLLHDPASNETAVIDAPDAAPIKAALAERGWHLSHIFITHHHTDHTAGIAELKAEYGAAVIVPHAEIDRISESTEGVSEASRLTFAGHPVEVIETPGHTLGHVTYVFPDDRIAFTGDTLFSLGCGRMFEGDAQMMWNSLSKITALPDDTRLYCGHEYTANNARFALSAEPENEALVARADEVQRLRAAKSATLPTTVGQEKATNPFLRVGSPAIRSRLGLLHAEDWEVFARLRQLKDKA